MSFLLIVRSKCTLAVSHVEYAHGTDRQTDGRQIVTSRFPLEEGSVIINRLEETKNRQVFCESEKKGNTTMHSNVINIQMFTVERTC